MEAGPAPSVANPAPAGAWCVLTTCASAASFTAAALAVLAALTALALLAALLFGSVRSSLSNTVRGRRVFYGEDARHAEKQAGAYHGLRLILDHAVDPVAVRRRVAALLKIEGATSMLRIRMLSTRHYVHSGAPIAELAESLVLAGPSGVDDPTSQSALADQMWMEGRPIRIWVDGRVVDMMAHHGVFDGVRGVRTLNEVLGNTGRKGTITPADLPCCALAARPEKLARVLAFERPNGTLRTRADASNGAHHSYYLRVPTELIKRAKQTDGLGFAAALQGLVLWSLFRCEGAPSALHVACTVGFKSDFWARLGSAFNHYGAFPFAAADAPSPQALGRALARAQRRNGLVSGFACLLANASTGGLAIGGSMAKMYNAIDVLIGGGPLVLDPSCGYEDYHLYKYKHTVPIYIFYATLCDNIDISIQSRVPLDGLSKAFTAGMAHLGGEGVPTVAATPTTRAVAA